MGPKEWLEKLVSAVQELTVSTSAVISEVDFDYDVFSNEDAFKDARPTKETVQQETEYKASAQAFNEITRAAQANVKCAEENADHLTYEKIYPNNPGN